MATKRTYMNPIDGTVVTFRENRTYMSPFGSVVQERLISAPAGGRIMSSLARHGGLAAQGGMAGIGGGLAA